MKRIKKLKIIIPLVVIISLLVSTIWFLFRASPAEAGIPVFWLKFDEGYGTTAYDDSAQGKNGTITRGATYTPSGKFGYWHYCQ